MYGADPTTRKYWEGVIEKIRQYSEVIAWSNVPQCVRCCGCPEVFGNCQFYKNLMKDATIEDQQDLIKRYNIYNEKIRQLVLTDQSN